VFEQAAEQGISFEADPQAVDYTRLAESHEQGLLTSLSRYPEAVESAALNEEPHLLTHYLRELANDFHTYYNAHKFLIDDAALRDARLQLILATRQVLRNGLNLLGVSAPEKM
jgi:arginyl-tRNA synthetase